MSWDSSPSGGGRELLGQAYRKMGDLEAAEHHYRQCMATADKHRNGTTKVTKLFLAEVLLQETTRETSLKQRSCCRRLT